MKKGAEPLRSFSDLAQFLGHIKPVDPEEEKRRKKQERIAGRSTGSTQKRETDEAKAQSPEQEQEPAGEVQTPEIHPEPLVTETSPEVVPEYKPE